MSHSSTILAYTINANLNYYMQDEPSVQKSSLIYQLDWHTHKIQKDGSSRPLVFQDNLQFLYQDTTLRSK